MLDPHTQQRLKKSVEDQIGQDMGVLTRLRAEIEELRQRTQAIEPITTTSFSVVGADGGNNQIQFDPFLVQVVRVVDSNNHEYCLEAVTPTTDVRRLSADQFESGEPCTALGAMMKALDVKDLTALSPMIRRTDDSPFATR